MRRLLSVIVALALTTGMTAQNPVAEIPFDAADILKLPDGVYLGEAAGVATNSHGHLFVFTRTGPAHAAVGASRTFYKGGSRLFEFDATGRFVKEIGQGIYGFNFAQAVRVDPQDNIWAVDQGSTQVIKFDPQGGVLMVFSRKPESIPVAAVTLGRGTGPAGGGAAATPPAAGRTGGAAAQAGAGIPGDSFTRTADVAWDRAGNIYVADGAGDGTGNARVAKFDRDGRFIRTWGSRGSGPGQFSALRGIAVDGSGNVYVADSGNKRIQVFDGDGNVKAQIGGIGTPSAICMTNGSHRYLYSSNSNDPETMDNGEIYKLELDGRIVGKFGRAGKSLKEFGTVNAIDCRVENQLFVGELLNWRVQKLTLHPGR
ncbi:MAG: 6-bladed beta-propeller [Vicinamibacterales bacterium]